MLHFQVEIKNARYLKNLPSFLYYFFLNSVLVSKELKGMYHTSRSPTLSLPQMVRMERAVEQL